MKNSLIDKNSAVPAYHQIANDLRKRILSGEWRENEKLPSENELTRLYSSSRVTIRQALTALEKSNLIKKIRGSGSVVQKRPESIIHDFSLPSTLCTKLGQTGISLEAKIIEISKISGISYINDTLKIDSEQNLIYIKRLFLQSERAIAINNSWISEKLLPDVLEKGLIDNHLSKTLSSRYNLTPVRIENTLEAVIATSAEINLLDILFDTPMISVTSVSFLLYDVPLEYSKTLWLADRVKFHFNMGDMVNLQ